MNNTLIKEGEFEYYEQGEGTPIIVLHGLMGGLSNFKDLFAHFPAKGYRIIIPQLPLFKLPILKTNVKSLSKYLYNFLAHKNITKAVLLGNSLGGHIALYFTKYNPEKVLGLVLTGSSGLYEKSMGSTFPKRGNKTYITEKVQDVFYDPAIATDEIIDEVFETVGDNNKVIRVLYLAKSAIRHNMKKDIPNITVPVDLIWGKNDNVTPPEVATEFHELLPNSELHWIDKCGHAPMMERPKIFNKLVEEWLVKNNF